MNLPPTTNLAPICHCPNSVDNADCHHRGASATLTILTHYLEEFIAAWNKCPTPDLSRFLPSDPNIRHDVLVELIKCDLEFRWNQGIEPWYLEDYLRLFPELQNEIPLSLIYEEFHVRRSSGLQVSSEEYAARFPAQSDSIRRLLGEPSQTQSVSLLHQTGRDALTKLTVGQSIDDFHLILPLGEGSFAKVFLAKQVTLQRLVALKVSADRGKEAQTLAQFDHHYIVRVYDQRSLQDLGIRLLYMEYIPGGTMHDLVQLLKRTAPQKRKGSLLFDCVSQQMTQRGEVPAGKTPWRQEWEESHWVDTVCWLGSCLADALVHAHQQDVLHRDIKPANILLTAEGIPKLADFNISYCSKVEGISPNTFFGGSLAYMSPEQLEACDPRHTRTADDMDHRSDLFSLGVVLFELLTGRRPFTDAQHAQTDRQPDRNDVLKTMAQRRRSSNFHFPDQLHIPEIIRQTIQKCLAPDPDQRWQSALQLATRLRLCRQPRLRQFFFPETTSIRRSVLPHSRLLLIAAFLLPNILAAVFNFYYNESKIIQPMALQLGSNAHQVSQHFMLVQTLINLMAFPLGIYQNDSFIRRSLASTIKATESPTSKGWSDILKVGWRCALLTLLMWTLAGLAYPLSMSLQAVEVSFLFYAHFFFSLLLCGLFAVALTYFNLTAFAFWVLVPEAVRIGKTECRLGSVVEDLQKRNWMLLLVSAVVPMLASVALATLNDPTPWVLASISLGGMLAFGCCHWLMNQIQVAASRLEVAFRNSPEAGFSETT